MNDATFMGEVESDHELPAKLAHNRGWNHALSEPDAKAPQGFPHELKHRAHMGTIGPLVLEIVYEMAYKLVAGKLAIAIAKVPENLALKYRLVLTVALCAQHLECSVFVLIVRTARIGLFQRTGQAKEGS
jgi:hypothetical protein